MKNERMKIGVEWLVSCDERFISHGLGECFGNEWFMSVV